MSECLSSDYLRRLFDLLKTNSRPPLLSLALARNSTGSCPSAEMRKGVPFSFLDVPPPEKDLTSWVTTQGNGLLSSKPAFTSQPAPPKRSFQLMRLGVSPSRRLATGLMYLHTHASRNLFSGVSWNCVEECLPYFYVTKEHPNAHDLIRKKAGSLFGLCVWLMWTYGRNRKVSTWGNHQEWSTPSLRF